MKREPAPVVLVVDDDPAICQALSLHLRFRGMKVHTANNVGAALQRLGEGGITLVVTDLGLPDGTGHEIIRRTKTELKGLDPRPEFVVMTANPTLDNAVAAFEEGACQFLQKPISTAFLEIVVKRALELADLRTSLREMTQEKKDMVLASLAAATGEVGLAGALEAVLTAADMLLAPTRAVLWVMGARPGELATITPAGGAPAPPSDEHRAAAMAAYEQGHAVFQWGSDSRYAAVPIILEERPEGVLSVEFARGVEVPAEAERNAALSALAGHCANAMRKEQVFSTLQHSSEQIHSLVSVGLAMSSETSLQGLFDVIVDSAANVCGAGRCSLMLLDHDQAHLRMRAVRGIDPDIAAAVVVPVGQGIAGSVVASGEALYIEDIEQDARFGHANAKQYRDRSLISVPIRRGNIVVGVLNVSNKADGSSFTHNDFNLMALLASQAAVAIDNAERYQDLNLKAITDSLTGVYLRRHFDEALARTFRATKADGGTFALLMVDIDHFKGVNDNYGHASGDAALRAVAAVLKDAVRGDDLVARYGGEEFVLILARASDAIALAIGERVRRKLETTPLDAGGQSITVTVSVGVSVFTEAYESAEDLLRAADAAMYQAKQTGRNRVCLAP
jgi:diguanylate cyclase (GGDEF)-like protein